MTQDMLKLPPQSRKIRDIKAGKLKSSHVVVFLTLSQFRSNLIHTQAGLLLDYRHLFTIPSFSAKQNSLDIWKKAFCSVSASLEGNRI